MVVGLCLKRKLPPGDEVHDARIVDKDADQPRLVGFLSRRHDVALKHRVEHVGLAVVRHVDAGLEGLVNTVLGPRLGEHLELGVARLALECPVVTLDGLHLSEVHGESTLTRERHEAVIIELKNRHNLDHRLHVHGIHKGSPDHAIDHKALHHLVGEDLGAELTRSLKRDATGQAVLGTGSCRGQGSHPEAMRSFEQTLGLGICCTRKGRNLDDTRIGVLIKGRIPERHHRRRRHDWVAEQLCNHGADVVCRQVVTSQKKQVTHLNGRHALNA